MTVVQQQDIAGGQILRQAGQHTLRVYLAGVEAAPGPADQTQVEAV